LVNTTIFYEFNCILLIYCKNKLIITKKPQEIKIFGGGLKYVHVASSKKFGHKNPKVAGVSFIWLPLATWVTYEVSLIV